MIVAVDNVALFSLNAYAALRERYYSGGSLGLTTITELSRFDHGVYRVPLTDPSCNYNRVDVDIIKVHPFLPPNLWETTSGVTDFTSRSATQFVATGITGDVGAETIEDVVTVLNGQTINFTITVVVSTSGSSSASVSVCLNGGGCQTFDSLTDGTHTLSFSVTASGDSDYITILVNEIGSGTITATITAPNYYYLTGEVITETKTYDIDCNCSNQDIHLQWLNPKGGYDSWKFTAKKDINRSITASGSTSKNIFPTWPNSYGEFADTDKRKQTFRDSRREILVRSQHLTEDQVDIISGIKSSPVVQIVNSIYDRRTVEVDQQSFTERKESDKLHEISFVITYTDDLPSQRA